MKLIVHILVFSVLCISDLFGQDKKGPCYGKLGCFSQDKPWVTSGRPFPPPESPEKMDITVTYFNPKLAPQGIPFKIYPETTFKKPEKYSGRKRQVIIIHGFASSANASWVGEMKDAYFRFSDVNLFTVNWEKGASNTNYLQAAANTRVVGAAVGYFGTDLIQQFGGSVRDTHLIGHSLGSHIAAYAANGISSRVKKGAFYKEVNRVTGLDPAQPGFQNESEVVRLDPSDGNFVEVVHSDARPFIPGFGFGYLTDMGTVDFYLNNGFSQPGCNDVPLKDINSVGALKDIPVETISKAVACSHGRAYEIYTSALRQDPRCRFIGHRVTSRTPIITSNQTAPCNSEECLKLDKETSQLAEGAFQIYTGSEKPYCCKNYDDNVKMCLGDTTPPTTPAVTTPGVTTPGATTPGATTPEVTTPAAPATTPPVGVGK